LSGLDEVYGISVAGVYRMEDDDIVSIKGAGGVSPLDATDTFRSEEAWYAVGWYKSITSDTWG
jgi:sulfide dehydrogenase [flavocytochrome c] flavoprotein subunit